MPIFNKTCLGCLVGGGSGSGCVATYWVGKDVVLLLLGD